MRTNFRVFSFLCGLSLSASAIASGVPEAELQVGGFKRPASDQISLSFLKTYSGYLLHNSNLDFAISIHSSKESSIDNIDKLEGYWFYKDTALVHALLDSNLDIPDSLITHSSTRTHATSTQLYTILDGSMGFIFSPIKVHHLAPSMMLGINFSSISSSSSLQESKILISSDSLFYARNLSINIDAYGIGIYLQPRLQYRIWRLLFDATCDIGINYLVYLRVSDPISRVFPVLPEPLQAHLDMGYILNRWYVKVGLAYNPFKPHLTLTFGHLFEN
jgi:hypothetical protein